MLQLRSLILSIGLTALLAGCQLSGPGTSAPGDVTPNAVAGDAIEVTALEAPVETPTPSETDTTKADPGTKAQTGAPTLPEADPSPEPAPQPDLGETPAEETAPVEVKSDAQIACEKKKGIWSSFGEAGHVCVFNTRDAGKTCTKGSQCDGECLARSGTCAPVKPLVGCNDVFQDDGQRVSLCIE